MQHETASALPAIGIIEDDLIMGESLTQRLNLEGYKTSWWKTGEEACEQMKDSCPDLVICDLRLPDVNGDVLFHKIQTECNAPPFLFITAYADIDQAVSLMRAGAGDYVTKPFEIPDFLNRIEALLLQRTTSGNNAAVLGVSPPMREVESLLKRIADIDSTILLTGETGVGKEVAARFLHDACNRCDQPFMAVNCAAIPAELIESELFGHVKGAFTGAHDNHAGYAERAKQGILFLDEIGDLPLAAQTRLLRLLQERTFSRVGGENDIAFNARVICATNADLQQLVTEKEFRNDLFYRINVIPVHIAPLRERGEDIIPLVNQYLEFYAHAMNRDMVGISSLAQEAAINYDWPGNVRELRNRVERAVALGDSGLIGPADLFPELGATNARSKDTIATLADVRDAAERRQIMRALEKTKGQTGKAAALLSVSRTTLWEKMRHLNLQMD